MVYWALFASYSISDNNINNNDALFFVYAFCHCNRLIMSRVDVTYFLFRCKKKNAHKQWIIMFVVQFDFMIYTNVVVASARPVVLTNIISIIVLAWAFYVDSPKKNATQNQCISICVHCRYIYIDDIIAQWNEQLYISWHITLQTIYRCKR